MLVEKSERPIMAGLIVKNSEFYIELAKFVQAYTTIINHPNLFLREVGEPNIADGDKLNWKQMSTILRKCDFGFSNAPTDMDLLVFYNYALEIGSVDSIDKKVASVDQVSDAQKSYYNFVDDAKNKAEEKYFKAHRAKKNNDAEISYINNQLSKINMMKYLAFAFMTLSVIVFAFCGVSFVFENTLSKIVGAIFNFENGNILALVLIMLLSAVFFLLFDKLFQKQSKKYQMLFKASQTIFSSAGDFRRQYAILRHKLVILENQLKIVQNELESESKEFDVKTNIDNLVKTNKYYKELCTPENKIQKTTNLDQSEFEPVVLSRVDAQQEGLESGIILEEGQFDTEAYNKEFEMSRKTLKDQHESQIFDETEAEKRKEELQEEQKLKKEEQENKNQLQENMKTQQEMLKNVEQTDKEMELMDSIEYIKSILGIEEDNNEYEK